MSVDSSTSNHPSEQQLRQFATGNLSDPQLESISAHLENCMFCLAGLETRLTDKTKSDPMIQDLKLVDSAEEPTGGNFETALDSADKQAASGDSSDPMWGAIESLGKYRVIKKLGAGGMGAVYLAEHEVMDREAAIKVIRHELVSNPEAVIRFRNEVRSAAKLSHRNIVTAYDAEQANGVHFLVMEYVRGETLTDLVRRKGPLSVRHACNYALQVAHALNHAHKQNMVHRDIKPSNLMRTPRGEVKVLDFGLARINDAEDAMTLTSTGVMMGTADYIAPEQARDAKSADIRSDLYSLGCTLFYLLTQRPPFEAETKVDKILAHCSTEFPNASKFRQDVPDGVLRIINQLTAKDAAQRYQTPRELIEVLSPFGKSQKQVPADSAKDAPVAMVSKPSIHKKEARYISRTNSRKAGLSRRVILGGLLVLAIPLLWFVGSFFLGDRFSQGGPKNSTDNNAQNSTAPSSERPRVLLVMSSDNFWFADYQPVSEVMGRENIELIVTANRAGTANFNTSSLDPSSNRHVVKIERSLVEWVTDDVASSIDAVLFIGTDTGEFRQNDATGRAARQLLQSMRTQKKWVASIGKGSEVPLHYGIYDEIDICDSDYLDARARRNNARMVNRNVLEVAEEKILTASKWTDAEALAEKLAAALKR